MNSARGQWWSTSLFLGDFMAQVLGYTGLPYVLPDVAVVCKRWHQLIGGKQLQPIWFRACCDIWRQRINEEEDMYFSETNASREERRAKDKKALEAQISVMAPRLQYLGSIVSWQTQFRRFWQANHTTDVVVLVDLTDKNHRAFTLDEFLRHRSTFALDDGETPSDGLSWDRDLPRGCERTVEMMLSNPTEALTNANVLKMLNSMTAIQQYNTDQACRDLLHGLMDVFELTQRIKIGHSFCVHVVPCGDDSSIQDEVSAGDVRKHYSFVKKLREQARLTHSYYARCSDDLHQPCRRRSGTLWVGPAKPNNGKAWQDWELQGQLFLETWNKKGQRVNTHLSDIATCFDHLRNSFGCLRQLRARYKTRRCLQKSLRVHGNVPSMWICGEQRAWSRLPTTAEMAVSVPVGKPKVRASPVYEFTCYRWMPPGELPMTSVRCVTCKTGWVDDCSHLCMDCVKKLPPQQCIRCIEAQTPDRLWPFRCDNPSRPHKKRRLTNLLHLMPATFEPPI